MCIHSLHTHIKENCTYFKVISVYKIWMISQHVEIGGGHIGLAEAGKVRGDDIGILILA